MSVTPVAKIFSDEFPSEDRIKTLLVPLVILSRVEIVVDFSCVCFCG